MSITVIEAPTLGRGWLDVSRAILERGVAATWGGLTTRELPRLTSRVAEPSTDDPVIAELGDPDWLAWMHANFFVHRRVPELGDARSYAHRLFDYGGAGRDQLAWVVDRLRADPTCRDADHHDLRAARRHHVHAVREHARLLAARGDAVELVVYAHGLDFGKKAYGNLVELAHLQERVAAPARGAASAGSLIHVKTAHVYEPEWELMAELTAAAPRT